jgi:peptidyl-prolyl cis-trans isomerase SurA
LYQLKEDFKEGFRDRKLATAMRNKIVGDIKITPNEVKSYFVKIPVDSLPYYETEVEVGQILVYPKASRDAEQYCIEQLTDYKKQIESGKKAFGTMASVYTEDPGSKDAGGQYTLNRNEKTWDPAFLSASFRLKEGQISPVVKSKFGLHIIQLVSRSGDEAVVRHILRIPPVTDDEIKEATTKVDSIKTALVNGSLAFNEAVSKFSDDENSKFSAGSVAGPNGSVFLTIDMLDKDMVVALKNLKPGQYSAPQVYIDERNRKAVRLINLKRRTEPHRENMLDDYNRIAQRAIEEKKGSVLEKWFKDHIPTYYVSIDTEYGNCDSLKDWKDAASKATANRK